MLELDSALPFSPAREDDFFPLLPSRPAVCLIEPNDERAEPYLIRTADLRRRLSRLLGPADPASKRLNLREFARGIRYRETPSDFEQSLTFYQHAKANFPKRYRDLMRLRPPAVLKVNLRNAYPRCFVTRRIAVDDAGLPAFGAYIGPFRSRKAADAFKDRFLDLFKIRRCQIKIRRDPSFPGCLYSEMKMCLAPCFAGCSKEDYDVEVQRVVDFLDSSGASLRTAFEKERELASDNLDFERASALHKKVEKVDEVLRGQPELPRRIQDLHAVIFQKSTAENTIALFAIRSGRLAEPFFLKFAETSEPRSAEARVREYLEGVMAAPPPQHSSPRSSSTDLSEHLSLVARWFYSSPHDGGIFFREEDWPYRRILRACTNLLAPKKEEPDATAPQSAPAKNEESR